LAKAFLFAGGTQKLGLLVAAGLGLPLTFSPVL